MTDYLDDPVARMVDGAVTEYLDEQCDPAGHAARVTPLEPVTARADDPALPTPTNVAEAVEALEHAKQTTHQYPDELVAVLLTHMDTAADAVARLERDRYSAHLDRTARNGRDLTDGIRGGLRLAARHLREDLASFRPGDPR